MEQITANYFIVSLLETLDRFETDCLPEELNREDVKDELLAVRSVLNLHPVDITLAISKIIAGLRNISYDVMADAEAFKSAVREVVKEGEDEVRTDLVFYCLLKRPTPAIQMAFEMEFEMPEELLNVPLDEDAPPIDPVVDEDAQPAESAAEAAAPATDPVVDEDAQPAESAADEVAPATDPVVDEDAQPAESAAEAAAPVDDPAADEDAQSADDEDAQSLDSAEDEDDGPIDFDSVFDELFGNQNHDNDDEDDNDNEGEGTVSCDSDEPQGPWLADTVQKTGEIQRFLLDRVFGQDQAVNTFVSGYFQSCMMARARGDSKKPQATFLFAGPPGVGKTYLAETAAEALGLPFCRFDMSEYADKEANIEFCGSDKVYKNGKAGNVTQFVADNPRCVLLFDEIEKAHINVIHLFLQMLDAGRLRDNFTDEEVSFTQAVLIFTTNVGKNLYDDPSVVNLSTLPRKQILKALSADMNPHTGAPLFPAAICSRFASGNVVMFNHLPASNLLTIVQRELANNANGLEESAGIRVVIEDKVHAAIMLSEGGKADARTVKGRANSFFHEELYELFRLLSSERVAGNVEELEEIRISVSLSNKNKEIVDMFVNSAVPEVLVFAADGMAARCVELLSNVKVHVTDQLDQAKDILFNNDISVILCDVNCHPEQTDRDLLNVEDIASAGGEFLSYALSRYDLPIYLLQSPTRSISQEELQSFAMVGVRGMLSPEEADFADSVLAKCDIAYRQNNMLKLAKSNRVLSYKTAQTISLDGKVAEILLFDFALTIATDAEDTKSVVDSVSKPDLHFDDVIGAKDAKNELAYFVEYLKNPTKFMRKGVRAPKGILLYGPPGTGKTMLAKAMAGESDVTFLAAEGNQFLKRLAGEGPEAVHAIFNAARKYAPSVLFIDEIDAIGKDRNSGSGNESAADILTAFLTEMDGFKTDTSKPVFVLAATNYSVEPGQGKSLDAALLRRFDRRIYVDLPGKEERKQYIRMKATKHRAIQLSEEQIDNIAVRSTGMSLADLESIFELALRNAIRADSGTVTDAVVEEAFETFNSGEEKKWDESSLTRTARHEAGHALVCWLGGEKPTYLTIVARGDHGGYMQHAHQEGKGSYTKAELLHRIRTSLAGRAAEIVYYGAEDGISTGASGDLHSATRMAENMICHYGMDDTVGMSYIDHRSELPAAIRERVNQLLREELANAVALIEKNRNAMDALVDELIRKNHLKEQEIDAVIKANTGV